jgi:hypothetical protein
MTKRRGMSATPEYMAWSGARQRCHNPKNPAYYRYGGRGIEVCDRWRNNFAAFLEDMGRRPSADHSLDRKDNDKGYEPGNCRWATMIEQQHNRRPWGKAGLKGAVKVRRRWMAQIQTNGNHRYLGLFKTPEEASAAYWAAYEAEQAEGKTP